MARCDIYIYIYIERERERERNSLSTDCGGSRGQNAEVLQQKNGKNYPEALTLTPKVLTVSVGS